MKTNIKDLARQIRSSRSTRRNNSEAKTINLLDDEHAPVTECLTVQDAGALLGTIPDTHMNEVVS